MIRRFLFGFTLLAASGAAFAQGPAANYVNTGLAVDVQVDALNFLNTGYFQADGIQFGSEVPWDATNTRNFTNRGTMFGSTGFRFDHVDYSGDRTPADNFVNIGVNSVVLAQDGAGIGSFFSGGGTAGSGNSFFGLDDVSHLDIRAANIVNQGLLNAGPGGEIHIEGDNVNLAGGGVIIDPLGSTNGSSFFSSFFPTTNSFFPAAGVYDLAWGVGSVTNLNLQSLILAPDPLSVQSGQITITNGLLGAFSQCTTFLFLTNASSFVLTSQPTISNQVVQVVVVGVSDTNIVPQVRFVPFTSPFNAPPTTYLSALVQLNSLETNLFTQRTITNQLYLLDQLPSSDAGNITTYGNVKAPTFRPSAFIIDRGGLLGQLFDFGQDTNDVLTPFTFSSSIYSNSIVTNVYAGYAAQIENTAARLPNLPDVGITNLPGRVEIEAGQLDLNRTRIRGEGLVSINATNFIGSSKALIDVPNLNYDLATTSPVLNVTNLARDTAQRLRGSLVAYSTLWTNTIPSTDPTNQPDIEVKFQFLIVDATRLQTIQPVAVHNLTLKSANPASQVLLSDNLDIVKTLRIDAQNLTVQGHLTLESGVEWDRSSLGRVQNLTNYGRISLPNLFGGNDFDLTSLSLSNFVNRGEIGALAFSIRSDYFENSGSIVATQDFHGVLTNFCFAVLTPFVTSGPSIGSIDVVANIAKLDGGSFGTAGDINFSGRIAKINQHALTAGGALRFDLSDVATDRGPSAGNIWSVGGGFQMSGHPEGDFFGTRIISSAGEFGIANHTWAGVNRGNTTNGFTNNLVIGQLELDGSRLSLFNFSGSGQKNALYVDKLQFSGVAFTNFANLADSLNLDNFDIFYGDVASETPEVTAETLDGKQFGTGRLHWVSSFAGPNSSVDVVEFINGQAVSVAVNRALRFSRLIDSDNDGIPNYFDEFPFNSATQISNIAVNAGTGQASITFNALPGGSYRLEAADTLAPADWHLVSTYQNSGSQATNHTVTDSTSNGQRIRFYRVTYTP